MSHVHAVRKASMRATVYLLLMGVVLVGWAAWATGGFKQVPGWFQVMRQLHPEDARLRDAGKNAEPEPVTCEMGVVITTYPSTFECWENVTVTTSPTVTFPGTVSTRGGPELGMPTATHIETGGGLGYAGSTVSQQLGQRSPL